MNSITRESLIRWFQEHGTEAENRAFSLITQALDAHHISITRKSQLFQFVWTPHGASVYVVPPYQWCLSGWIAFYAHEALHAAGHVRGTLPFEGKRFSTTDSTYPEERIAENGAIALCLDIGIEPDYDYAKKLGPLEKAERLEMLKRLKLLKRGMRQSLRNISWSLAKHGGIPSASTSDGWTASLP